MDALANTLIDFFKGAQRPLTLHEPYMAGNEWEYVKECLDTGWVSSVGSYVDRFEKDLGEFTGAYAIPVMNGTAALHLALILAGVEPGDLVAVPDLTFVATANAVSYCHATPYFVEVEEGSFAVDPDKFEAHLKTMSKKPKALLVTHIFGHPAPIKKLQSICETNGIVLIEDAAESLGSFTGNAHTGTTARLAALSFNGNKIMTTGGGGAVLTTDAELAKRAKHLSTTAKIADPYTHIHDAVGYNYRMPNINAAIGCAQLEQLPIFLKQKKELANCYKALLSGFDAVQWIDAPKDTISNYWLNNILMPDEVARNALIDALKEKEIYCRGLWAPMSSLPMYRDNSKMDTPVAQDLCARNVSLPSSANLIDYVSKP